ncbi:MAG: type IV pilin protein [Candidatus Accumulibacter sp.]|nr:type IV pilin protein [Accumulibacter sp.]
MDYVRRGKIMEAVSGLSSLLVKVEQCYQDNHTYADCYACKDDYLGDVNDGADNFEFACDSSGALPLTATGKNSMAGFTYTVTLNSNGRESRTTNISGVSGWSAHNPNNCWVTKKGGIC